MKNYSNFPCTKCGCCCTKINEVHLHLYDYTFPYKHANGRCEKLLNDNTCSVYKNRPLICNIDKYIDHYKLNKEKFYDKNIDICNKIMDENNIDLIFRIKKFT